MPQGERPMQYMRKLPLLRNRLELKNYAPPPPRPPLPKGLERPEPTDENLERMDRWLKQRYERERQWKNPEYQPFDYRRKREHGRA